MSVSAINPPPRHQTDPKLSLYHLLDPQVLADPYPLYHRLRTEAPVLWDPYLYAWVVTRYADIVTVLLQFSAKCAPTPEHLAAIGMPELAPVAQVMMRQMLFMDAPAHTRLRGLASMAFTPARVEVLRSHIQEIVDKLIEPINDAGRMDLIAHLAAPLPAIVASEMLGVPTSDRDQLKQWSEDFAEVLGNFQHNPNRAARTLKCVEEMSVYFRDAIRRCRTHPREGLVHSLVTAEIDGDRLTEEEIIANCIVTMVGAQETTTNLIGNGVLSLLRYPDQLQRLRDDPALIPSAVEELLRYESPSQHTTRLATEDTELGGKKIRKGQAVIVVMGAGNRDPERFADPDRLDVGRRDNRHLAFGWASHFCFGAALARIEGHIALDAIVNRLPDLALEPGPLVWRENLGLRGLTSLPVTFGKPLPACTAKSPVRQSESACPFH
jgi:cytochrome P450